LVSYHSHQTLIKDIKIIKIVSKNFDITLIGNFFDQTLKFDRFIDILSLQTRVKVLDRMYTSNPVNKISDVWSGDPRPPPKKKIVVKLFKKNKNGKKWNFTPSGLP
jgi:hypothetical protein